MSYEHGLSSKKIQRFLSRKLNQLGLAGQADEPPAAPGEDASPRDARTVQQIKLGAELMIDMQSGNETVRQQEL